MIIRCTDGKFYVCVRAFALPCVCVCICICVLASIYHCMMCLCYCTYVHVVPTACHSQHPIGGRVTVLQTSIPNVGPGALKDRDVSPSATKIVRVTIV